MPLVSEQVHPLSLDFANQRKAYLLRAVGKESFTSIAGKVVNLQGRRPSKDVVRRVCLHFSAKKGRRQFKYNRCGRKPWKLTEDVQSFLIRRLLAQRRSMICTSTTLQRELAKAKGITLETSTIRRFLTKKGYRWLPRAQKHKHDKKGKQARLKFAKSVVALSAAALREKLSFAMDGVVLGMPPSDPCGRLNFCRYGDSHMWRKPCEAASPELAGASTYGKQVPPERAVPMWAGISEGGFAIVLIHPRKKVTSEEWASAVRSGKLRDAIRSLRPIQRTGPWSVLCDNESFLRAPASRAAHDRCGVTLWGLPPKSPDLNPIEKFWSWLRRHLRILDLADLKKKKRPLSKTAYIARVRTVCRSQKAQVVASNLARSLKKTCREVIQKKGASARS